uniref:Uncharacterized protein n=1 Tax=Anopheles farauti TaxID=69004 RepID=A0A182QGM0_9DIPT
MFAQPLEPKYKSQSGTSITQSSDSAPGAAQSLCGGGTEKAKAANKAKTKSDETIDDPYEFLQTLLKNNNLVKEAVRRLQHGLSPKQRYFYESDEESSRSPIVVMCQLES